MNVKHRFLFHYEVINQHDKNTLGETEVYISLKAHKIIFFQAGLKHLKKKFFLIVIIIPWIIYR